MKKLRTTVFMTLRLYLIYEFTNYYSMMHLVNSTKDIVKENHPLKENLVDKINKF